MKESATLVLMIPITLTGQGGTLAKLHQPKTIWRMYLGFVTRERLGLVDPTQAMAYADAERKRAIH